MLRPARAPARRLLCLAAAMVLCAGLAGRARADKVDSLIAEMRGSSDYKVRLSAALNLAKLADPKAIPAFIDALADSDKTVRGVAAAALGTLVTSSTDPALRERASAALRKIAAKDSNAFVRKQAQQAYDKIQAIGGGPSTGKRPAIYINIGEMTDSTTAQMRPVMKRTVEDTFKKRASAMATTWPGGRVPSSRDLTASKTSAFYIDGTLTQLDVSQRGSTAQVSCKVSMLLATFPEKSMFGFLKGGASVQSGSSAKDVGFAKQDCVTAVIEDLVGNKIIPTIQRRVP